MVLPSCAHALSRPFLEGNQNRSLLVLRGSGGQFRPSGVIAVRIGSTSTNKYSYEPHLVDGTHWAVWQCPSQTE